MKEIDKKECNFIDIARVIGIFLVIFGHCNFYNPLFNYILYLFHMPLFVIISGILHKDNTCNSKSIIGLVYSLIIPFLIYNLLSLVFIYFKYGLDYFTQNRILDVLLGLEYPNIPTWFFLALFFVKLISLILNHINQYIVFSVVIIGLFMILQYFNFDFYKHNYYSIGAGLFLFPFYTIGILSQKYIFQKKYVFLKCVLIIISVLASYFMAIKGMHLSISEMRFHNVLLNIFIAILDSFSILFISQFFSSFIKTHIIKDISRGTMLIVGLHMVFFYQFLYPVQSIKLASLKSLGILVFFYFFIKLTYNRFPILYGRKKSK